MGTAYTLWEDKAQEKEVFIYEGSNELELCFAGLSDEGSYDILSTNKIPPREMLMLLMKGITAVSFWMSKEEFEEVFEALQVFPY